MPKKDDELTPDLNLDLIEKFVIDREYELIPEALAEGVDWGMIPHEPGLIDELKRAFADILDQQNGSLVDLLLMKNEDGSINYLMLIMIYSTAFLILVTSLATMKEAISPSEAQDSKKSK